THATAAQGVARSLNGQRLHHSADRGRGEGADRTGAGDAVGGQVCRAAARAGAGGHPSLHGGVSQLPAAAGAGGLKRPLVALVLAQALSLTGTRLSTVAIPWLVLTATGDPVLTGLVGLAEMLLYVVAKALGGPWVDRLG